MGEAADAILDGTFCEGCGEVFDDIIAGDDPPGHPRRCARCRPKGAVQIMSLEDGRQMFPRTTASIDRAMRELADAMGGVLPGDELGPPEIEMFLPGPARRRRYHR